MRAQATTAVLVAWACAGVLAEPIRVTAEGPVALDGSVTADAERLPEGSPFVTYELEVPDRWGSFTARAWARSVDLCLELVDLAADPPRPLVRIDDSVGFDPVLTWFTRPGERYGLRVICWQPEGAPFRLDASWEESAEPARLSRGRPSAFEPGAGPLLFVADEPGFVAARARADLGTRLVLEREGPSGLTEVGRSGPPVQGEIELRLYSDAGALHRLRAEGPVQGEVAVELADRLHLPAPAPASFRSTLDDHDPRGVDDDPEARYELFPFRADAAGMLIASMRSPQIDSYLELFVDDGTMSAPVAYNDDHDGLDAQITAEVRAQTDYVLRARSYSGQSGPFELSAQIHALAKPTRVTLVDGAPTVIRGRIKVEDESVPLEMRFVEYAFTTDRAGLLAVRMTSLQIDSHLELFEDHGTDRTSIATDDDSGGHRNATATTRCEPGQGYVVRASSTTGEQGAFDVEIDVLPMPEPTPVELKPGDPLIREGRLTGTDARDDLGAVYDAYLVDSPGPVTLDAWVRSDELDTRVELRRVNADGSTTLLVEADDVGEGTDAGVRWMLEPGARYEVRACSFMNETGWYELELVLREPEPALVVEPGRPLVIARDPREHRDPLDTMLFRVRPARAGTLTVSMRSPDHDPHLSVSGPGPDGPTELASNDDADGLNARLSLDVSHEIEYLVRGGFWGETGPFEIRFVLEPAGD